MSEFTDDASKINLAPSALKPRRPPFWGDGAFRRESIASELSKLVADLARGDGPATIALDGGYGTGKTFVLERWVQEMKHQGRIAVYYDAWANDCDDEPLVSLIETLATDAYKGAYARKLPKAFARCRTTTRLLGATLMRRRSREKLKEKFAKLVEEVGKESTSGAVVVIDELDRCRPQFTFELLECIKHVLNVPGLVFVFGVNMASLRESVKAVYGAIDAHQYLLPMFTTILNMPPGVTFQGGDLNGHWRSYLKYLADRHRLWESCEGDQALLDDLERSLDLLRLAATAGSFTPRELEHVMWLISKFALSLLSDGPQTTMLPEVLVPLAVVRVKDPDGYRRTVFTPDNGPAVIDGFFGLIHDHNLSELDLKRMDAVEMMMYKICHRHPPDVRESCSPAYAALQEFVKNGDTSVLNSRHLSRRSSRVSRERAKALLKTAQNLPPSDGMGADLTFEFLQRLTSRFDVLWLGSHAP